MGFENKISKKKNKSSEKKKKSLKNKKKLKINAIGKQVIEEKSILHTDASSKQTDSFLEHFNTNIKNQYDFEIRYKSEKQEWPHLNRVIYQYPERNSNHVEKIELFLEDTTICSPSIKKLSVLKLSDDFLCEEIRGKINLDKLSGAQKELLVIMNQYVDVYYPESKFNHELRLLFSLHCMNHVLKTRQLILEHHEKINVYGTHVGQRYNGFTRPKVLILTPFKNCAYNIIKRMMTILPRDAISTKKFERIYGPPEEDVYKNKKKPNDFLQLFEGDIDEDFQIGLSITKKSLKLFCDLYESDIIVGSPLSIRRYMESKGDDKSFNCDFLSSIEIFVLDMADVFTMQNWEHVTIIQESLNLPLSDINNLYGDALRIRHWCLEDQSRHYKQTIVLGSTYNDLNAAFIEKEKNFCGRVQVLNLVHEGSAADVTVPANLILRRVPNIGHSLSPNAHFDYFTQHIYPNLRLNQCGHTMIYVPDYFDYNRIVSFLKEDQGTSMSTINEYMIAENSKVAKARGQFFEGRTKYLIYTERFHFYRRYKIKGIQHILFYNLPTYPHFFSEICNFMAEEYQFKASLPVIGGNTVTALYQAAEFTKLVGVLGTEGATEILDSEKPYHKCSIGTLKD